MDRIIAGEEVTDAEATSNDNRQAAFGLIQLALGIAAAVVFIRWLHAAYKNVDWSSRRPSGATAPAGRSAAGSCRS